MRATRAWAAIAAGLLWMGCGGTTSNDEPVPVSITTASLPGGTVGVAYSATLQASGGTAPYTWSVLAGALPAGLTLSSGGAITGAPSAVGTASFTVQANDAASGSATRPLAITVVAANVLAVTTTTLPTGTTGTPYSATLQASGGTSPYAWEVYQPGLYGDLPPGLSLDAGTGAITGTPTTQGAFSFQVRVTDQSLPPKEALRALSITVDYAAILGISTVTLPNGTTGAAYAQTVAVAGGTPSYTWEIFQPGIYGNLPPGLSLDAGTGAITGTPTTQGAFSFQVRVTDQSLPPQEAFRALSITVDYAAILSISTVTLPNGTTGAAYAQTVAVAGGTPPYTWELFLPGIYGDLPPGLALDPGTGAITGTPTTQGAFSFQVRVTDQSLPPQEAFRSLSITVDYASILSISTVTLPNGTTGAAYAQTVAVAGGTPPYTWELFLPGIYGDLPPGLALDPGTGAITGTPTTQGAFSFQVRVTDQSLPPQEAFRSLSITVDYASILSISTVTLPQAISGIPYSATVAATGGTPPYAWEIYLPGVNGDLPGGLTLDPATGEIAGTTAATPGTYSFTVRVSDQSLPPQEDFRALSITIP